jgi:RyR domain
VRTLLQTVPTVATPPPGRLNRFWLRVLGVYEGWTVRRRFGLTITVFFLVLGVFDVAQIVIIRTHYASIHTVAQWATLVSSVVTLVFIVIGAVILPRARLSAFKWFEAALLVSIFLTQVFLFAERQLAAVIDLGIAIVVWVALRAAIRLEVLARGIHDSYRERRLRTLGVDDPSVADWDSLPETLRASNRDQAAHFVEKLNVIHCGVIRSEGGSADFTFTPAEIETLAKLEHQRWMAERRRQGWTPGPTRDPKTRTTPYLVDWNELSEPVRDLDRDAVREIPTQLAQAGYAVIRL